MFASGKFNNQEVDAMYILGDVNGDGELDLEEFIGMMCPSAMDALSKFSKTVKNINEAQMLFRILDKDGDGMISNEEMRNCGQKFNAREIDAIFAIGDINNDGYGDLLIGAYGNDETAIPGLRLLKVALLREPLTDVEKDVEKNVEKNVEKDIEQDVEQDVEKDVEKDAEQDVFKG